MRDLNPALDKIIEQSKKSPEKFRFVFDLDSTLFCVSPRSQQILRDLAEELEFKRRYPSETEKLKVIEALPTDWGIRMMLERSKIHSTIGFFEEVRSYWVEHFFSNDYLKYDIPYEGAVEFVNYVYAQGLDVWYLTGRDIVRMQEGSLKSLRQWNLPLRHPHQLTMKPKPGLNDEEFKVERLREWIGVGKEIIFFENEPVIIEKVRRDLPQVQIVFMESVHSGRSESPTDLLSLPMSFKVRP